MEKLGDEILIRPYQHGDEDKIVQLLELGFQGWPKFDLEYKPLFHWRWKYLDNPYKKHYTIVAILDREIIGCLHSLPLELKLGEKIYNCALGGDLTVHPKYRRRGLTNKLTEARDRLWKENKVVFSAYETQNPILINFDKKRFPPFPHEVRIYVLIKDIHLHNRKRQKIKYYERYGYKITRLFNRLRNRSEKPKSKSFLQITEIESFDSRSQDLWEELKDNFRYSVVKTKRYLNWRYCDLRGGRYQIFMAQDDEKVLGYIVLRINRLNEEYPTGHILDVINNPDRPDVTEALIKKAIENFDSKGANIVNCLVVNGNSLEKTLSKNGFLYSRRNLAIYYVTLKNMQKEIKLIEESSPNFIQYHFGNTDTI